MHKKHHQYRLIKQLNANTESLLVELNKIISTEKLTNETLSKINNLRVKISQNTRKVENVREGLPENGLSEEGSGYSLLTDLNID